MFIEFRFLNRDRCHRGFSSGMRGQKHCVNYVYYYRCGMEWSDCAFAGKGDLRSTYQTLAVCSCDDSAEHRVA